MFFGRGQELSRLHEEFAAKRPSLLVVYGRRRVGKSELLKEATTGRPHIIFQATRVTSDLNLQTFKAEIAHSLGSDALLDSLNDWMGVLTYLARKAEDIPGLVVVLDEFPYLVDTNPALPSIVQKFWDLVVAGNGSLNLVLCGSLIAQMEELLAEQILCMADGRCRWMSSLCHCGMPHNSSRIIQRKIAFRPTPYLAVYRPIFGSVMRPGTSGGTSSISCSRTPP